VRAICAALAALFAFVVITNYRAHHVDYQPPPAHHATPEDDR
jgi:hypothetical protein